MRSKHIWLMLYLLCVFSFAVQAAAGERLLTVDRKVEFPVYNTRLGGQGSTAIYSFDANEAWVVEEARYQLALGSDVFKFMLRPYVAKYAGRDPHTEEGRPYTEPVNNLVDRAKNVPAFRTVLDMPFRYTMIWAFPIAGLNKDYTGTYSSKAAGINLGDGYSQAEAEVEYKELYDLTQYLMEKYQNTGRSFLIGNWEGDWVLLGGQGDLPQNKGKKKRKWEPSEEKIEAMRAWFANRQKAVEDARNSLPDIKGVYVYHYVEVNHFEFAMDKKKGNGDNRLVNRVLPNITVDAVSYSSWSATNKTKKLPKRLHDHLDFIEKNAKFTGYWPFEKAVFVGEYGLKEDAGNIKAITAAAEWGCPFTLFWCILPNYPTNTHYMIDSKGNPTQAYLTHKEALSKIIAQRDIFRMYLHRDPAESELNSLIANFKDVNISDILSQALDHPEFVKLIDNQTYLEALFQQILLTKDYKKDLFSALLDKLNKGYFNRWATLQYLLNSKQCRSAVSDADFAKWLHTNVIVKPENTIELVDLKKTEASLSKKKRSDSWLKFLNSAASHDAAARTRFQNTEADYKDWIYENSVSDSIYGHYSADLR